MQADTWKKAVLCGVIYGALTLVAYIVFTCAVYYIMGGETFIYKDETRETLNGISFTALEIIGGLVSALIPVFFIRCKTVGNYLISIGSGIITYALGFVIVYAIMFLIFFFVLSAGAEYCIFPLNTFDFLFYGIAVFPTGAFAGMAVTAVVNCIINMKKRK